MINKLFYIDELSSTYKTYADLVDEINKNEIKTKIVSSSKSYDIFVDLLTAVVHNQTVYLIDSLVENEVVFDENIESTSQVIKTNIDLNSLLNSLNSENSSKIILFTSGTTSKPKQVAHNLKSLTRFVKTGEKYKDHVWGLTYNPVHIAALQVFFQAIYNLNTIVYLYRYSNNDIIELIEKYKITHISATPTFYKLLLPSTKKIEHVQSLTFGGEKFDQNVVDKIKPLFPNAKIKNIYASTEIGSLFISDSEIYEVPESISKYVKIYDNHLFVHKSLLEHNFLHKDSQINEWFETGDLVDIINENPLKFKFVGRTDDIVKIGGFRVNLIEVEQTIEQHPNVTKARVYTKSNSLTGYILLADVMTNGIITEKEIVNYLKEKLPEYKIPRIITIVETIEVTKTGKVKRK